MTLISLPLITAAMEDGEESQAKKKKKRKAMNLPRLVSPEECSVESRGLMERLAAWKGTLSLQASWKA